MTEQTKTSAVVETPSTLIPGIPATTTDAVGVTTVAGAIIWAIFHFRRKASRDGNQIVQDRTEGLLLEKVMLERDGARNAERVAWTKANELAVINARQEEKIRYQAEEIVRLNNMVAAMQIQFDELKKRLQKLSQGATGHSGLQPPV